MGPQDQAAGLPQVHALPACHDRVPVHGSGGFTNWAYTTRDFVSLVDADALDCLQADVTRCGGITGMLEVAGLAAARHLDLSAHRAPAVSAHACCAVRRLRHLESVRAVGVRPARPGRHGGRVPDSRADLPSGQLRSPERQMVCETAVIDNPA